MVNAGYSPTASHTAYSADEPYSSLHGKELPQRSQKSRAGPLAAVKSWSRKKKILVFGLLGLALLALILGLAIGLTVGKGSSKGSDDGSFVPATADGSQPLDGSRASMLQAGSFYTATDNSSSFTWTPFSASNLSLGNYRGESQGVDVILDSTTTFQPIDGFGSALTDSAAYLMTQLKQSQPGTYDRLMDYLFNNATGYQLLRITMGASDFSLSEYTYIPASKAPSFERAASQLNNLDEMLAGFSIENTATTKYVLPVLNDALQRNPQLKVMLSPWSPPPFMKSKNSIDGGTLRDGFEPAAAEYYFRTAQAFAAKGVVPFAMTLQNEPSFPTDYPSMTINATVQGRMAQQLKNRLAASSNLAGVKVLAHDDNWSGWQRAASIVNDNSTAVDGVAFHCYRGSPDEVANYTSTLNASLRGNGGSTGPEIHLTECTGTESPTSRWSALQGWLTRVHLPMLAQGTRSVIMWNLALDEKNGPYLKQGYCQNCVGALTIDTSNSTSALLVGAQAYLVTQLSAATRDLTNVGGGKAVRIQSTFPGSQASLSRDQSSCMDVVAFAAPLNAATLSRPNNGNNVQDQRRVGLVVDNRCERRNDLVVSSDGRRVTLSAGPGLTTFVWTAP